MLHSAAWCGSASQSSATRRPNSNAETPNQPLSLSVSETIVWKEGLCTLFSRVLLLLGGGCTTMKPLTLFYTICTLPVVDFPPPPCTYTSDLLFAVAWPLLKCRRRLWSILFFLQCGSWNHKCFTTTTFFELAYKGQSHNFSNQVREHCKNYLVKTTSECTVKKFTLL